MALLECGNVPRKSGGDVASLERKINHSITEKRRVNGTFVYLVILAIALTLGLVAMLLNPWVRTISAVDCWLLGVGYWLTIFGISIGVHRLLTHQSFRSYRTIKFTFLALGATAFQGFLLTWARRHRDHHRHADVACDGKLKAEKGECDWHTPRDGFLHSFTGWLVETREDGSEGEDHWTGAEHRLGIVRQNKRDGWQEREATLLDIIENRELAKFFDRTLFWWVIAGLLIPALIGGLVTHSWLGALSGLFWGGVFRMAVVNTSTYLVNSYLHKRGWLGNYRHAEIADDSNNNMILGIFNPEAFHWGHHAFSWAANHGIIWYERILDHSASIIWLMERCRLVWEVRWVTGADLMKLKRDLARKVVPA